MQRAVSDSDVIIHLAKLNELTLIRELYGCAYIPEYVEFEIVGLLEKLRGEEFRIHPNIINKAIDSCKML